VVVQVGSHIQEALDIRLKDIKDKVEELKGEISDSQNDLTTTLDNSLERIITLLAERE
jgi:archaellum component FlaC